MLTDSFHVNVSIFKLTHYCVDFYLSLLLYRVCLHLFLHQSLKYPNAANADVKDIKEGKEGQDVKEGYKDGKDTDLSRSVSVMSSLSYRKRSNLKDSIGGTGDENSLFSTLKEQPDTPDRSSLRKAKNKPNEKAGDDLDDRGSVISQAYSEAASRARKGLERRWTKTSPEFDKESVVSSVALSRTSLRRGLDQDNDASSTVSGYSVRRSMSWIDDGRSDCGSAVSPGLSRGSGGRSPGSISLSSRTSLARSSRLSEFGVNLQDNDDAMSVFTEGGVSSYSRSPGRSFSSPAQSRSGGGEALDDTDIKPVSHRNYLDPELEKAINEVLSFKPIKFKRRSLEDSDEDKADAGEEEDDKKSIRSVKSSLQYDDDEDDDDIKLHRSTSRLQRSASGSALDYTRSSSSLSSRSRSSSRKDKKKKSRNSGSESSSADERRKGSKKKGKKGSKKGKRKESESESSESESSDSSSSSSSAVSYRSSNSIKKGPGRGAPGSDDEVGLDGLAEERPQSKQEVRKKKKKVDSLVMKYLYRPDSD